MLSGVYDAHLPVCGFILLRAVRAELPSGRIFNEVGRPGLEVFSKDEIRFIIVGINMKSECGMDFFVKLKLLTAHRGF